MRRVGGSEEGGHSVSLVTILSAHFLRSTALTWQLWTLARLLRKEGFVGCRPTDKCWAMRMQIQGQLFGGLRGCEEGEWVQPSIGGCHHCAPRSA